MSLSERTIACLAGAALVLPCAFGQVADPQLYADDAAHDIFAELSPAGADVCDVDLPTTE